MTANQPYTHNPDPCVFKKNGMTFLSIESESLGRIIKNFRPQARRWDLEKYFGVPLDIEACQDFHVVSPRNNEKFPGQPVKAYMNGGKGLLLTADGCIHDGQKTLVYESELRKIKESWNSQDAN